MNQQNPFHPGELEAQRITGEEAIGQRNSRVLADRIPDGALAFIEEQPMIVLGSRDEGGRIWASLLFGRPGFLRVREERAVAIDLDPTRDDPENPLWRNIALDSRVGALVIDLESRRRLRVNGRLTREDPGTLRFDVEEVYPNCPKYIQRRVIRSGESGAVDGARTNGQELGAAQRAILAAADTLFVASAHPERGLDASHRGGRPGFVEVIDDRTLRIPDYAGNSMFNTLGNLLVDPMAGLVVPDFTNRRALHITGATKVSFEGGGAETGGTGRYWELTVDQWFESPLPAALEFEYLDASPHNP